MPFLLCTHAEIVDAWGTTGEEIEFETEAEAISRGLIDIKKEVYKATQYAIDGWTGTWNMKDHEEEMSKIVQSLHQQFLETKNVTWGKYYRFNVMIK